MTLLLIEGRRTDRVRNAECRYARGLRFFTIEEARPPVRAHIPVLRADPWRPEDKFPQQFAENQGMRVTTC